MRTNLIPMFLITAMAFATTSCVGAADGASSTVTVTSTVRVTATPLGTSEKVQRQTAAFEKCSVSEKGISMDVGQTTGDCAALAPISIDHPEYGAQDFSVGLQASAAGLIYIRYWLLDPDGDVVKTKRSKEIGYGFHIENLRNDGSGNITYSYDPGRDDGCVALRPEGDWFAGFGTDPLQVGKGEEPYVTRFYGAIWTDTDGDDTYEILQYRYEDPDGEFPPTVYEWNGDDYERTDAPVPDL